MNHEIFITLLAYAIGEGFLWGGIFSHNAGVYIKQYNPHNIHLFIIPLRIVFIIVSLMTVPSDGGYSFLLNAWHVGAALLAFPFFHNGTYYETRRMLEPDTLSHYLWWHTSKTTTAKLNFPFWLRSVLMLAGFVLEGININL